MGGWFGRWELSGVSNILSTSPTKTLIQPNQQSTDRHPTNHNPAQSNAIHHRQTPRHPLTASNVSSANGRAGPSFRQTRTDTYTTQTQTDKVQTRTPPKHRHTVTHRVESLVGKGQGGGLVQTRTDTRARSPTKIKSTIPHPLTASKVSSANGRAGASFKSWTRRSVSRALACISSC